MLIKRKTKRLEFNLIGGRFLNNKIIDPFLSMGGNFYRIKISTQNPLSDVRKEQFVF